MDENAVYTIKMLAMHFFSTTIDKTHFKITRLTKREERWEEGIFHDKISKVFTDIKAMFLMVKYVSYGFRTEVI